MYARGDQTNYGKSNKLPTLLVNDQLFELVCQTCIHIFDNALTMPKEQYTSNEAWH